MRLRSLPYVIGAAFLTASLVYFFVYLYRWEWHRALIAGVIFIAGEVAFVGAKLMARMRAIERRLQDGRAPVAPAAPAAAPEEPHTNGSRRNRFAWLSGDPYDLHVFVPVLMGAGVLLSAVAWCVERVAAMTVRTTGGQIVVGSLPWETTRDRASRGKKVIVTIVIVAGAALALDTLADATQTRPDPPPAGGSTSFELAVSTRGGPTALAGGVALWASCKDQVESLLAGTTELGGGRMLLTLEPALGKYAERRLRGCLQDARLDRVTARVTGIRSR